MQKIKIRTEVLPETNKIVKILASINELSVLEQYARILDDWAKNFDLNEIESIYENTRQKNQVSAV